MISAICPKRLQPPDCIDLSDLLQPVIMLPHTSDATTLTKKSLFLQTCAASFITTPHPLKVPPFVGEHRSNSLEDFPNNGKDLLSINDFTHWSIPLYALANHATTSSVDAQ